MTRIVSAGLLVCLSGCFYAGPPLEEPRRPSCDEVCGESKLDIELLAAPEPDYWAVGFPGGGDLHAELRWDDTSVRCCLRSPCEYEDANGFPGCNADPDSVDVITISGPPVVSLFGLSDETSIELSVYHAGSEVHRESFELAYEFEREYYDYTDPGDPDTLVTAYCDECLRDGRNIEIAMPDVVTAEGFAGRCRGLNARVDELVGPVASHELNRSSGPPHESVVWRADSSGRVEVTLSTEPDREASLIVAEPQTCRILASDRGASATIELEVTEGDRLVIGTDRNATLAVAVQ